MSAGAAFVAIAQREAEDARCRAFMASFDPRTATVHDRREYARCVLRIDGDGGPARLSERLAVAGLVLAFIGGAIWGVLWMPPHKAIWSDMELMEIVMKAVIGGTISSASGALAYLLLLATRFVVRGR